MFYVDLMGNLLSNLRLAFYEQIEEGGFFSKMFSGSDQKIVKDAMVKSYTIMQELYNDLLTPVRLQQIRYDRYTAEEISKMLKLVNQNIARDRNIEDIKYNLMNIIELQ